MAILNTSSISRTDFYNVINIYYAYDYENSDYVSVYTYPETDTLNYSYQLSGRKRSVNIKMPFVYSKSVAEDWARKYYQMWANGLIIGSCEELGTTYYDQSLFQPYAGDNSDAHVYIATTAYLMWGNKARMYFSGFMIETDNENLWNW